MKIDVFLQKPVEVRAKIGPLLRRGVTGICYVSVKKSPFKKHRYCKQITTFRWPPKVVIPYCQLEF